MSLPAPIVPRPYLLMNKIQHYTWGSRGQDAFIPRFLGITAELGIAYAELWIGAHPKAPSEIILDGVAIPLLRVISECPLQILGDRVSREFSGHFPFLLKVLSVAEPLSIQAHPNREQAQALNKRDPEHYPDDNHKPELAIALDSLRALVGFRSIQELLHILERYPEIAHFIGLGIFYELRQKLRGSREPSPQEQQRLLRSMYSTLVEHSNTREKDLMQCLGQLEDRLRRSSDSLRQEEQLFLELRGRHSGADLGLISIFWLRPIQLKEGQGIFIEPGTPHVYLIGNIVECMANSDNVVRAGLTQKHTDLPILADILTYDTSPPPILSGNPGQEHAVYRTPAAEFQISRWRLRQNRMVVEPTGAGPKVLLVTKGRLRISWQADGGRREMDLSRGQSVLIPARLTEIRMMSLGSAQVFQVEVPQP